MAKKRYINTKFWSDDFIVELKPLERYFFLYLLTNEHTDICGIYELSLKVITRETDLEEKVILKMFSLLKAKIAYTDGWVYIKNFEKHQAVNPKVEEGIKRSKELIPKEILAKLTHNDIGYDSLSKATIASELLTPSLTLSPTPLYSLALGIALWNSRTAWPPNAPTPKNKTVAKLLPQCRKETEDLKVAWNKISPTQEEWELAVKNYILEIANRSSDNDYANHRFSMFDFIKQRNGYLKFINR